MVKMTMRDGDKIDIIKRTGFTVERYFSLWANLCYPFHQEWISDEFAHSRINQDCSVADVVYIHEIKTLIMYSLQCRLMKIS